MYRKCLSNVAFPFIIEQAGVVYVLHPTTISTTEASQLDVDHVRGVVFTPITRKAIRVITASRHFSASQGAWRAKRPPRLNSSNSLNTLRFRIQTRSGRETCSFKRWVLVSCFILGWTPYFLFGMAEIVTGRLCSVEFECAAEIVVALNDIASPCLALNLTNS
ncbi:hypothetical protein BC830DRAFT_1088354 [Chytriomyces sp. MP71]|nr:hypothetical protein BC830DRAFT_1088354 [Chytriomyces sp. MP71]